VWEVARSARYANVPLGLALVVVPWLLGYPIPLAAHSVVVGAALIGLAFIKGKLTQRYGGGWAGLWGEGTKRAE
jgi:hypothetical protein